MSFGFVMSAVRQIGQRALTHSPDPWASVVVSITMPLSRSTLRGLNDRKLMLAQRMADNVEPSREWRIAIALPLVSRSPSVDDAGQGLYRVHKLDLSLGECCGELRDRLTARAHAGLPHWP